MLQGEHSAILSTFIKLSFIIKIFVLSIFEWPLKTGFTVYHGTRARCLKDKKLVFKTIYRLMQVLNSDQKYCRMLKGEHSAIPWTFIKLSSVP